jgi:uncharacterized secreted protein with C-terminal beta-propeller domain
MARLHTSLGIGGILALVAGSWACGGNDATLKGDPPVTAGEGEFISAASNGSVGGNAVAGEAADSAGALNGASPTAPNRESADEDSVGGGDAARAIAEADILQLSGDRLYALSRYRGLSIVDVSNPAQLRLEGEYRAAAEPFEMYVEDGLVYAMFNGWYSYVCDEQTGVCSWQAESRVQALDTRDPSNIRVLADLEVPGYIADSRRVGDVLYLATDQWGYCWGCEAQSNVTVTSFDLSQPGTFTQVDQLRLPNPPNRESGGHSITVTDQRMYIAGYEYDTTNYNYLPSTVQVVDISEPSGALVKGATFSVGGTIQSRWQMDEFDGVFRAVSQPGGWGSDQPPVMQTFRVNSSSDVQALASLTVQLPRPREVLQSARFDGGRGYLITAEQRDPLFTFDLSDPANPRQLGELEMPGFVYHMEPRGNRVYALGFDNQNEQGSLHVSLFDVENLAEPKLLSRVPFGGVWGNFAEGQNQIHKAFSILPEQGLIMVPFSAGSYDEQSCTYDYGSGIQLVDFTDATLTKRGVAPQVGNARRALLHRDRLFGIGDNSVQTFDIDNRDAPVALGQLDVARNVSTVRVLGDHLMRFGSDWMTQQTILDLTPVARAEQAQPEAEIDLAALFGEDAWSCNGGAYWSGQVFTRGDFAYVPRTTYRYDNQSGASYQRMTIYVVDLSDRAAPRAVGSFDISSGVNGYTTGVVQTENALLVGRQVGNYTYNNRGYPTSAPRFFYDVFELSDPSAPTKASTFEVPANIANYGWGYFGVAGCAIDMGWGWYGGGGSTELTDRDIVVSQHAEPVQNDPYRVRYYLDRIDVSDPYNPQMLPQINIPGTAIHFNADTNELVTIDQQETVEAATSWEDCSARGAWGYYENSPAFCRVTRRSLNSLVLEGDRAVRKSIIELDDDRRTVSIAVSDNRIFYTTGDFPMYYGYLDEAAAREGQPVEMVPITLETVELDNGELNRLPATVLRELPRNSYYYSQLYAREERVFELFDNNVTVIDTLDPEAPTRLERELPIWGCASLEVAGDTAYCAAGQRGVEVIDLSSMR